MKTIPPSLTPHASPDPEALIMEARRRQRRRYLLVGMVVAVVLAAVAAIIPAITGNSAPTRAASPGILPASQPVSYTSPPSYSAYLLQGSLYSYVAGGTQYGESVTGRYIQIRTTATGKLLTTVSPPKPYNNFILFTATANGRMFVFGAMRYWQRNVNAPPKVRRLSAVTPLKFLVLRITAGGRTQLSQLSLPGTVTPGQHPTIALSPDGTRLAVAFGGDGKTAVVRVITLVTGEMRQWTLPHVSWTPFVRWYGAWTAGGRTLAIEQQIILSAQGSSSTTQVRLLDTTGPGTSLASGKLLMPRPPAGQVAPASPVLTPDGAKLIFAVGSRTRGPLTMSWAGDLAVYSARTGALLQTLAPWTWHESLPQSGGGGTDPGFPNQAVVWTNQSGSWLILQQPMGNRNVTGTLTGNTFTPAKREFWPRPAPQSTGG